MGRLHRHFLPGQCVFVTFACQQRIPWLGADADKARQLQIMRAVFQPHSVACHAWVLLADHVHLLVTDPVADVPLWMQKLKLRFVRSDPRRPLRVWQRRYWDHVIRDRMDLLRHVDYIHQNPVKHGLVAFPRDYAWSSFAHFVRRGWYPQDWQAVAPEPAEAGACWGE